MRVERIDHIHVAVKDIEGAARFFERILGTKFSESIVDSAIGIGVRSMVDRLGVELLESLSDQGPVARFIKKRGEGLHAICFKVDDIDAWIKHLQEQGLRLVGDVTVGKVREVEFHPKDSYGFMIELCEFEDKLPSYLAAMDRG